MGIERRGKPIWGMFVLENFDADGCSLSVALFEDGNTRLQTRHRFKPRMDRSPIRRIDYHDMDNQ